MARRIAIIVLVGGALLVTVFAGFGGLFVYLALAGVAAAFTYALSAGGAWLEHSSRRRFDDDRKKR